MLKNKITKKKEEAKMEIVRGREESNKITTCAVLFKEPGKQVILLGDCGNVFIAKFFTEIATEGYVETVVADADSLEDFSTEILKKAMENKVAAVAFFKEAANKRKEEQAEKNRLIAELLLKEEKDAAV